MHPKSVGHFLFRCCGWLLSLAAGAAVLWVSQPLGMGVTGDSVGFIHTAHALAEGLGWQGNTPLYPPAFPVLLAPFPLFGIDPAAGGRYLQAGLLVATLILSWHWLLSRLESRSAALFGLLALASAAPMLESAGTLLTEMPFIFTTALALITADRYWRDGTVTWLVAFALCCAVAGSLRYVAVTLVMTGAILIAVRPGLPAWGKLRHTLLFGAVSASLTLVWLLRNWLVAGSLLGHRSSSVETPATSLNRTWRVVSDWLWPANPWDIPPFAVSMVGLGIAVIAMLMVMKRTSRALLPPPLPMAMALFLPVYLVFIVLVKLRVGNMEPRYLAPAVLPLWLLAAHGIERCLLRCRAAGPPGRPLAILLTLGLFIWLLGYPVVKAGAVLNFHHADGWAGYNAKPWQDIEGVALLRQRQLTGTVFSNLPRPVYFHSGLPTERIPNATALNDPAQRQAFRQRVARALAQGLPVHLMYLRSPITGQWDNDPPPPARLNATLALTPVLRTRDGSAMLFSVTGVRPAP